MKVKKIKIIFVIITCSMAIFGGLAFAKLKLQTLSTIVYPEVRVKLDGYNYYINSGDSMIYKSDAGYKHRVRITKDKVLKVGIIELKNKIYYISSINNELCQIDANGINRTVIAKCNIIMPYQPIFKLGEHIYFYDSRNSLRRLNIKGDIDSI